MPQAPPTLTPVLRSVLVFLALHTRVTRFWGNTSAQTEKGSGRTCLEPFASVFQVGDAVSMLLLLGRQTLYTVLDEFLQRRRQERKENRHSQALILALPFIIFFLSHFIYLQGGGRGTGCHSLHGEVRGRFAGSLSLCGLVYTAMLWRLREILVPGQQHTLSTGHFFFF